MMINQPISAPTQLNPKLAAQLAALKKLTQGNIPQYQQPPAPVNGGPVSSPLANASVPAPAKPPLQTPPPPPSASTQTATTQSVPRQKSSAPGNSATPPQISNNQPSTQTPAQQQASNEFDNRYYNQNSGGLVPKGNTISGGGTGYQDSPQQSPPFGSNPPAGVNYLDPQVEAALKAQLGQGVRDTTADEASATQTNQRQEQQALADARAKAGFGGMGLSGAATAQQSDIRRASGDALTQNLLNIRQNARQENYQNLGLASDAMNQEAQRQAASLLQSTQETFQGSQNAQDRAVQQQILGAVQKIINGGNGSNGSTTGSQSTNSGGSSPASTSNGVPNPSDPGMVKNSPLPGSTKLGTTGDGQYDEYETANGETYWVKK